MGFLESANVGGLVVFGTASSLLAKIIYELHAPGRDGHMKPFHKPWACTTMMFVGMTFCLPLSWAIDFFQRRKAARKAKHATPQLSDASDASAPLLQVSPFAAHATKAHEEGPGLRGILLLAVPMAFDLIATILLSVGLLTTSASVSQMLKGSGMVFSALFAVFFLHRSLNKLHYFGIAGALVGMGIVGAASLMSGDSGVSKVEPAQMAIGMTLIALSQATQSAQCVAEDYMMSEMSIPPLTVVGIEGLFGSIVLFGIILPVAQVLPFKEGGGLAEDSIESFHMIMDSPALLWVTLASVAVYLLYNSAGMYVTEELGAVTRTVLETMRTLFVWAGGLALFYASATGKVGESWNGLNSWAQAGGFAILAVGTIVYGRGDEEVEKEEATLETRLSTADPDRMQRTLTKRPAVKGARSLINTVQARRYVLAERFVQRLQDEVRESHDRQEETGQRGARRFVGRLRAEVAANHADEQAPALSGSANGADRV
mmetsp:Transcript_1788/g.5204  ORF Transcript_1788/g.5204 Transcript_1788/m.5204 type:complete len:487 (-) Transcript_1788:640-2100(-)|eukprot:CAMPEP_0206140028 /NCGR_PEP_ID=MMETSP1473-20131121/8076_1 /ASSEMBLY_ACC=CAM_ASM_001109 /TAXON_ID=1461547 /ORGANISM="Stichococcus sp, Strain RCC1054" /LENGTH=486 /DNA_ID=CAMNT_0053534015 /DNA_START=146 /DNA_END=1606 /DNA_ORIENTATION=-